MIGPPRIVPKMPGSWRATAVLCVTAVGGYRALRCSTALPTLGRDAVLPFGGDSIAHRSRGTYKMHAVDAPADSPMRRKPPRRCRKGVDVVFSTLNVSLRPRVAADNQREHGDLGGYAASGIASAFISRSGYQCLKMP